MQKEISYEKNFNNYNTLFINNYCMTSFLWLSWSLIAVLSLGHIVLLESCNGCFLSHAQFNDKNKNNTAFYEWWFEKIGIKIIIEIS